MLTKKPRAVVVSMIKRVFVYFSVCIAGVFIAPPHTHAYIMRACTTTALSRLTFFCVSSSAIAEVNLVKHLVDNGPQNDIDLSSAIYLRQIKDNTEQPK